MQDCDVLIVGAGISGIGAAVHLQHRCPNVSLRIVEARQRIGGTWDLFRYPGIRSDSDMHTLGFSFKPWNSEQVIASGAQIAKYLGDTVREFGLDEHIQCGQRVEKASFDGTHKRWLVTLRDVATSRTSELRCRWLFMGTGYYDYKQGHTPDLPGKDTFQGPVIHPQHWPGNFDYRGKRIVVIGSGATAMSLVPALAKDAAHVTMLQRSPSYVLALPSHDNIWSGVRRLLPRSTVATAARWQRMSVARLMYRLCQRHPRLARRWLIARVQRALPGFDVATHFSPNYGPWDQRLCILPDGDLFGVLRNGQAEIVTDEIRRLTATGIELRSGSQLTADVIVTATGLKLQLMSNIEIDVDGQKIDAAQCITYRGAMLSGVPNLVLCLGYPNASWTLRSELVANFTCDLLRHMEARGYQQCVPVADEGAQPTRPYINLTSNYVRRGSQRFPMQGTSEPWTLDYDYPADRRSLRRAIVDDRQLQFS